MIICEKLRGVHKSWLNFVKCILDTFYLRLVILALAFGGSVALYCYAKPIVDCFLKDSSPYLRDIIYPLPVLLCLWWFRTYDVRQDRGQQRLLDALKNVSNQDDPLTVDIAVHQLLQLSKENPHYNKEIELAFIRRLKKFPLSKPSEDSSKTENLAYAQHILMWLIKHKCKGDFAGFILDKQDFSAPGSFSDIAHYFKDTIHTWSTRRIGITDRDIDSSIYRKQFPKVSYRTIPAVHHTIRWWQKLCG